MLIVNLDSCMCFESRKCPNVLNNLMSYYTVASVPVLCVLALKAHEPLTALSLRDEGV